MPGPPPEWILVRMAELAGSLLCHWYLWSPLVWFLYLLCHQQTIARQNYFNRKSFRNWKCISILRSSFPNSINVLKLQRPQQLSHFPHWKPSFYHAFFMLLLYYFSSFPKCISFEFQDELFYIETSLPVKFESKDFKMPPFKDMFLSLPVWALMLAHMGNNWGMYTLLTEMPTYLTSVHHFDISSVRRFHSVWK